MLGKKPSPNLLFMLTVVFVLSLCLVFKLLGGGGGEREKDWRADKGCAC